MPAYPSQRALKVVGDTVSQVVIAPFELVPIVGPALGATPEKISGAKQATCADIAPPEDKPAM